VIQTQTHCCDTDIDTLGHIGIRVGSTHSSESEPWAGRLSASEVLSDLTFDGFVAVVLAIYICI
jgi:hypothetical protein